MRLTALTVGSRGGRAALPGPGGGLQRAGHQVTLATHRPFEPDARRLGSGSRRPRATLDRCWRPNRSAWLEAGRHPLRGTRRLLAVARPLAARLLADATAACQDAEAIIYAPLGFGGAQIAERTASRRCWPRCCRSAPPGRSWPGRARLAVGWRLQPCSATWSPSSSAGSRSAGDQPVAAPHPGAAARAAAWTRPRSAAPTSTGPHHRDRLHRRGQEALRRQAPGQGGCSGRRPSGRPAALRRTQRRGHERHGLASVGPPLIGYDAALPKASSRSAVVDGCGCFSGVPLCLGGIGV